ncbi:DNA adenine methylase [Nostoc linckia]|uniref:DNA adenine methylase n=1 Tax=Nostoc linckia TaxID=92942 RepID=UPI000BFFF044|nr:DNA adenine methylase [Nostoc linckia]
MSFKRIYRSPLRYPGGKQKDVPFLSQFLPHCQEFREPFLGGANVLIYAVENSLAKSYWGNDLNTSLIDFWQQVKLDAYQLANIVEEIREEYKGEQGNCREWQIFRKRFMSKLNKLTNNQLNTAAKFFILNRSTSSGSSECGGMTQAAYCQRFTLSSIETLKKMMGVLENVDFTNLDYEEVIKAPGKEVFIFLDPPYFSSKASGLYGKNGNLHRTFDHQRLSNLLKDCPHDWLMTIDSCQEIKELYGWAKQLEWEKAYGMTNFGGRKSKRGEELLVANFTIGNLNKKQYIQLS